MEPLSILIFIIFWVISSIISAKNRQSPRPGERRAGPGRRRAAGWPVPPRAAPAEPAPVEPPIAGPAQSAPPLAAPAQSPSAVAFAVPERPAATTPALAAPAFTAPAPAAQASSEPDAETGLAPLITGLLDPQSVMAGIVFSEVIGPPKARRASWRRVGTPGRLQTTRWSGRER